MQQDNPFLEIAGALVSDSLIVPRGRKGLAPLTISMKEVHAVEGRIPDLKMSNYMTLPDLVTDFNIGIARLGKIIGVVMLERREAEQELEEATSIALLDRVDAYLASKQQKSTADTRAAAVVLDADVKAAKQKVDILRTVVELLQNKYSAIEMAYYSAKKICDLQMKSPDLPNYAGDTTKRGKYE